MTTSEMNKNDGYNLVLGFLIARDAPDIILSGLRAAYSEGKKQEKISDLATSEDSGAPTTSDELINKLNLSNRAYRSLTSDDIKTIRDLLDMSPEELLKIPKFGVSCLGEVVNALRERGLALAPGRKKRTAPLYDHLVPEIKRMQSLGMSPDRIRSALLRDKKIGDSVIPCEATIGKIMYAYTNHIN